MYDSDQTKVRLYFDCIGERCHVRNDSVNGLPVRCHIK